MAVTLEQYFPQVLAGDSLLLRESEFEVPKMVTGSVRALSTSVQGKKPRKIGPKHESPRMGNPSPCTLIYSAGESVEAPISHSWNVKGSRVLEGAIERYHKLR